MSLHIPSVCFLHSESVISELCFFEYVNVSYISNWSRAAVLFRYRTYMTFLWCGIISNYILSVRGVRSDRMTSVLEKTRV